MTSKISLIVFCALFSHCCAELVCYEVDTSDQKLQPPKSTESAIFPVHKDGCGWSKNNGVGFNHNKAQFGEFPWMVAILFIGVVNNSHVLYYHCGGSLIAPQWVLTAAHCVDKRAANQVVVRAGEWDSKNTDEKLKHVETQVKEIFIHKSYDRGSYENDVALLFVEEPFVWQENIRPICLPESNTDFNHSRCYLTGWGQDTQGKYQEILKKINLPIVPRDTCKTLIRKATSNPYYEIHESFLCAGGEEGKSACKGDGGSPLVCPIPGNENRYYQAGLVALGFGCGVENRPNLFASVEHARPWISEVLKAKGVPFFSFIP